MRIRRGDDVTISGTVLNFCTDNTICILSSSNHLYYICEDDVKTIRPNGKNGKGKWEGKRNEDERG